MKRLVGFTGDIHARIAIGVTASVFVAEQVIIGLEGVTGLG
jgi:hypothetical protein